ncbi:FAD-dependent oxidoreductase [Nannocystis pusilla]|uniref:FAD-dependent oxidoreductase n=1 Tax=Nannocystis pusilla TaxID=889268 RepID=UPI003B787628
MRGPKVIVVGGGTMGSATAWALAARGAEVTVLERFSHVHELGSHSGYTRIIRESYHEGPATFRWSAAPTRCGRRSARRPARRCWCAPGWSSSGRRTTPTTRTRSRPACRRRSSTS